MRTNGFPYVSIIRCDKKDQMDCLEQLEEKGKGKQLVTKTEIFSEKACLGCKVYVRLYCEEQCEIDLHVQSKYSQTELKEGKIVSDFTD